MKTLLFLKMDSLLGESRILKMAVGGVKVGKIKPHAFFYKQRFISTQPWCCLTVS